MGAAALARGHTVWRGTRLRSQQSVTAQAVLLLPWARVRQLDRVRIDPLMLAGRDLMSEPPKRPQEPTKRKPRRKKRTQTAADAPLALVPDGEVLPVVSRADAVQAIRSGQWLPLVPHETAEQAFFALFDAMDAELANEASELRWATVLQRAEVPWVAWMAMRETDEGRAVWQTWGARCADMQLALARKMTWQAVDRDSSAAAQVNVQLARWMAERMDALTFSDKATGNDRGGGNVTIVVQNEIPNRSDP